MKKQTLKTLFAVVLALALSLSMSISSFATTYSSDSISTRTVNNISKSFVASSSTSARATVQAASSGTTPFITAKIILQSAPLGSSSYSNVSGVSPSSKTVTGRTSISHSANFTISSNKDYRVRIELTDAVDGIETTTTTYCYLSR